MFKFAAKFKIMDGYPKIGHIPEKEKDHSLLDVKCDICRTKIMEVERYGGSIVQVKCRRCGTLLRITI